MVAKQTGEVALKNRVTTVSDSSKCSFSTEMEGVVLNQDVERPDQTVAPIDQRQYKPTDVTTDQEVNVEDLPTHGMPQLLSDEHNHCTKLIQTSIKGPTPISHRKSQTSEGTPPDIAADENIPARNSTDHADIVNNSKEKSAVMKIEEKQPLGEQLVNEVTELPSDTMSRSKVIELSEVDEFNLKDEGIVTKNNEENMTVDELEKGDSEVKTDPESSKSAEDISDEESDAKNKDDTEDADPNAQETKSSKSAEEDDNDEESDAETQDDTKEITEITTKFVERFHISGQPCECECSAGEESSSESETDLITSHLKELSVEEKKKVPTATLR